MRSICGRKLPKFAPPPHGAAALVLRALIGVHGLSFAGFGR